MIESPIILFDGVCNFCNSTVNFILKQDKKQVFRFAALQSTTGQKLLKKHHLPQQEFNSFLFIDNNKSYLASTAALRLVRYLPWYWQWTQLFWLVPRFVRDGIYRLIANNRYKWFGKRETCMIPSPEVRKRFLQ
ncbi:MAG TPA: thiol-disulfide oxidoreductase DCC family protein [Flavisolibacter sp.]|nr:thiol-disulfide oxidoreductase DCC family protein [Flavisolibacter sp.]